jgi:hypothetical protein
VVKPAIAALLVMLAWAAVARAEPEIATSDILREGNTAALAGDWPRVTALVEPLLQQPVASADLAEANRLAGIAAFFQHRQDTAESCFVAYLRVERDGRLDPALYPPDVVAFFNDVASRHAAELRAMRVPAKQRSWWLTVLPPLGQLQNGEHAKAYVIGGVLTVSVAVNLITYGYLSSWCDRSEGSDGSTLSCPRNGDHTRAARSLQPWNIGSGIVAVATYAYGIYDGVRGYRRVSQNRARQLFVAGTVGGGVVGFVGSF